MLLRTTPYHVDDPLPVHSLVHALLTYQFSSIRGQMRTALSSNGVRYALSQLEMSHLNLKDEQQRVIREVYRGRDVFVVLPTGFGKSICFQVLPFLFDHKLGLVGGEKSCAIV